MRLIFRGCALLIGLLLASNQCFAQVVRLPILRLPLNPGSTQGLYVDVYDRIEVGNWDTWYWYDLIDSASDAGDDLIYRAAGVVGEAAVIVEADSEATAKATPPIGTSAIRPGVNVSGSIFGIISGAFAEESSYTYCKSSIDMAAITRTQIIEHPTIETRGSELGEPVTLQGFITLADNGDDLGYLLYTENDYTHAHGRILVGASFLEYHYFGGAGWAVLGQLGTSSMSDPTSPPEDIDHFYADGMNTTFNFSEARQVNDLIPIETEFFAVTQAHHYGTESVLKVGTHDYAFIGWCFAEDIEME
jgi:hypothetical protein